MKKISIILLTFILAIVLTGCSNQIFSSYNRTQIKSEELQFKTPENDAPVAVIQTNLGTIKAVLYKSQAPIAVENFTYLAVNGYYDGLEFYRVIQGFALQGGSPNNNGADGTSKWGTPFANELSDSLHHYTGALCMSNRDAEGLTSTNTSIFYIVQSAQNSVTSKIASQLKQAGVRQEVIDTYKQSGGTPYLDNLNTVFGQVIQGLDIVDNIAIQEVDENDKPTNPVIIQSITISTYGVESALQASMPQ